MFCDMNIDICILFLFSINLLVKCVAEERVGSSLNTEKLEETYKGLSVNLNSLLKSTADLNKDSKTKDELINVLWPLIANTSTTKIRLKNLSETCPKAYNNLSRLEHTILRKLLDNSDRHNERIYDIYHNINCFGIKPAAIDELSMNFEKDMQRYANLLGKVENVKHKLELHNASRAVIEAGQNEFSKILSEITQKLNDQENRLERLEVQTSSIEKATAYLAIKINRSKCMKCLQKKIIENLKAHGK